MPLRRDGPSGSGPAAFPGASGAAEPAGLRLGAAASLKQLLSSSVQAHARLNSRAAGEETSLLPALGISSLDSATLLPCKQEDVT